MARSPSLPSYESKQGLPSTNFTICCKKKKQSIERGLTPLFQSTGGWGGRSGHPRPFNNHHWPPSPLTLLPTFSLPPSPLSLPLSRERRLDGLPALTSPFLPPFSLFSSLYFTLPPSSLMSHFKCHNHPN